MLDKVNEDITQTTEDMIKLDSKLKTLLAKGSICWLWIMIIIEFVALVGMLSWLAGG